jgi:O-antigen ligase
LSKEEESSLFLLSNYAKKQTVKTFFWICLGLIIPGLLARLPFGGAGILLTDLLVPLFVFVWIGSKIIQNKPFPRIFWMNAAFIFVFLAIGSFLIGAWDLDFSDKIVSGAYIWRLISFCFFGMTAADLFREHPEKFFRNFFFLSGIVIFLGFIQFQFIPDISKFSTEGGLDPHTGRLLGTWLDPNYLAGFIGFLLPLLVGNLYQSDHKKTQFWLFVLAIVSFLALFLTFSRSGYLATGIGLLFFFAFRDPKIILLGICAIALGIGSSERAQQRIEELSGTISSIIMQDTDEIDPTAKLRIQNWQKSFSLVEKYPFTGIGYNTYRFRAAEEGVVDENYFSSGGADSTHLTILVTTGILGFLSYLLWIGLLFFGNFKQRKDPIFLGFVSGLLSLFVHACFVNSLFFPLIFLPVIAVAGVLGRKK